MALAFRIYEMARQRARGKKRKNIMGTKVEKTMFVPQYLYIAKEAVVLLKMQHAVYRNAENEIVAVGPKLCLCP